MSQALLNGEGVPEHVGMAALRRAISLSQVNQFEEAAIAALPIGNDALRLPIATPEKVTWIRLRTGRNILESLDHLWRERHIDRCSGLGLVEKKAIAMKAMPLKSHCVANAEAAPAHQQGHFAKPNSVVLYWNDAAALVATP